MSKTENNLMEKIVSLCKRRGFVYPGSEIYGGLANTYSYGPLGAELKNNIKKVWWKYFVEDREDMLGLDGGILLSPKVWEASGHVQNFKDPLAECKKCHHRFREDLIEGNLPSHKASAASARTAAERSPNRKCSAACSKPSSVRLKKRG